MAVSFAPSTGEVDVSSIASNVIAHRGQQEAPSKTELPVYDPACYLCPGNKRAQGDQNPQYKNTFIFLNDYSAVKEEQAAYQQESVDGGTWITRP